MALNFVTSATPLSWSSHLGSSERGSQVLRSHLRVPSHVNARRASSLTIICINRHTSASHSSTPPAVPPSPTGGLSRNDFPADFLFGCSTSALQTESKPHEGGRGNSTWDHFLEDRNAVDSYHNYKEDVELLKDMGANTYRFSISWSRIFPNGSATDEPNEEGVQFYNRLIDELLQNGITPFVTLFHFDLPSALDKEYGGFKSVKIVDDFKAYADFCFKTYGNRVRHWTTINEPQSFVNICYTPELWKEEEGDKAKDHATTGLGKEEEGETARLGKEKEGDKEGKKEEGDKETAGLEKEGGDKLKEPFTQVHNMILAHASAVKHYRDKYQKDQKGEIGISLVTRWFLPHEDTRRDREACERALDFLVGWLMEPLVYGDYPFIMKAVAREALTVFTEEQRALIKGSFDFIGVNYYTTRYATSFPYSDQKPDCYDKYNLVDEKEKNKEGNLIGPQAPGASFIRVYPQGLKEILLFITEAYGKPKLYVTENGYADANHNDLPMEMAIQDGARVKHMNDHLTAVQEALKEGADVNGYIMWALMDCMEMGAGYKSRFGLYYTDYTGKPPYSRIPKLSAQWLKHFLSMFPSV